MKVISKIVALAFALLFAFPALAADEVDVSKLPDSTLSSEQIDETLSGRSVHGVNSKLNEVELTFIKNGGLIYRMGNYSATGTWKTENNSLCLMFRKMNDVCPVQVTVVAGKLHIGDNRFVQK